jgi:tRNA modification GTPase
MLDLNQADGVADLIASRSEVQARAALRSLEGEFSRRADALAKLIVRLRVEIEAAIDFSDEASEGASKPVIERLFEDAANGLQALLAAARRGVRLTDGMHAVIVGEPNVGKSSLLNALAGNDRAIVTEMPGTTRDVLRESIVLGDVELTLADTAGLRESTDLVEGEGIRRARVELARADLVLRVVERTAAVASATLFDGTPPSAARILIINKIDLDGVPPSRSERGGALCIALSARTGEGLDLLRTALREAALGDERGGEFSARSRHVLALERAGASLQNARSALATATPELIAEDLVAAQRALGAIVGTFTSEDLLGAVFSTFCIGK